MNPLLADFRRKRALLHDLATGIHPERWREAGLAPDAVGRLVSCPRSRRTLSLNLAWAGEASEARWEKWDMTPGRREAWALLPGDELWRGGLRFGAARFREKIAHLVWRDDVKALKAVVGEDAYTFAMRQATLVWHNARLDEAESGGSLADDILASAVLALGCWLASIPGDLAARARLKLPPGVDAGLEAATAWSAPRRDAWLAVLERVFARLPAV